MGEYRYLSRREEQVLEIVRRNGIASAIDVRQALPGNPAIAGVRVTMAALERKGVLRQVGSSKGNALYEAVDRGEDVQIDALWPVRLRLR